jgi:hypothetical protein
MLLSHREKALARLGMMILWVQLMALSMKLAVTQLVERKELQIQSGLLLIPENQLLQMRVPQQRRD